jgi:hypothetical protein
MKFNMLLFSQLVKEPPDDKKWKHLVYKSASLLQYITMFFVVITTINLLFFRRNCDFSFWVPIAWYFAPLIFYYAMIYIAPAIFMLIIGILIYKLFR